MDFVPQENCRQDKGSGLTASGLMRLHYCKVSEFPVSPWEGNGEKKKICQI
jgi:hypothetical protein